MNIPVGSYSYIEGAAPTYLTARSTSSGFFSLDHAACGQCHGTPNFQIERGYLSFNTSVLVGKTISSAKLHMIAYPGNPIDDNFLIQIYRRIWTAPVTAGNVEANYDLAYDGTAVLEGTFRDTSAGWVAGTDYSMAVDEAELNLTGLTYYTVVSDADVNATEPDADHFSFIDITWAYLEVHYVGELPSTAHCWAEIENGPGDYPAGMKVLLQNNCPYSPAYLYAGMALHGVPRSDLPSKRYLVGNHFRPWIEAETDVTMMDGDTSVVYDAGSSGGYYIVTDPSDTTLGNRIEMPISIEPEDLWKRAGTYRILAMAMTAEQDVHHIQFRVTTAAHLGQMTRLQDVEPTLDWAWMALDPQHQIVRIPGHYIDPMHLQELTPGDWDYGTDGNYCHLEYWEQSDNIVTTYVYLDGVMLIPQDAEVYGSILDTASSYFGWILNTVLCIDTLSKEPRSAVMHDATGEQFRAGTDLWGGFYMPVKDPAVLVFLWTRVTATQNPDVAARFLADWLTISAKYRPRYMRLR
jgi:hypothetical protein